MALFYYLAMNTMCVHGVTIATATTCTTKLRLTPQCLKHQSSLVLYARTLSLPVTIMEGRLVLVDIDPVKAIQK